MDKNRWLYGDTNPAVAAVDADTVIEIGDLLWQDVDEAKPFNACLGGVAFKAEFLGVAMQRSRLNEDCPIRVATTGVFEFECKDSTFCLGDLVAPVTNQSVARSIRSLAIGRVAKRQPTKNTVVLVDIRSTVMTGGV